VTRDPGYTMCRQDLWLLYLLGAGHQLDNLENFPDFQPGTFIAVPAILHQSTIRSISNDPTGIIPVTFIGRIMSFSSCPRMWQCQTYS
jgi:hypothetical protein